jgi:hypothetical protein
MNNKMKYPWVVFLILAGFLLFGCGLGATTNSPASTNPPAVAKPPAAGDWVATTDYGKLVFTVDATGTKITKMSYQFSNWTCGPGTVSGSITASASWPITDNKISIDDDLSTSPNGTDLMSTSGTYSATDQKFTGTWSEDAYGNKCSGSWEATAP